MDCNKPLEEETEVIKESTNDSASYFDNRRYLYVCEGITDEDKLKKLGCLFVMTTGGKFIRKDILDFLEEVHHVRQLVVLTDPDTPGRDIRKRIEDRVGPCLDVKVKQSKAKDKNGKIGIAQMSMEDLKNTIRPYIRHDLYCDENLSLEEDDFFDLGLVGAGSKQKREILIQKYHLPFSSAKKVEECLLMLAKSKEDIENDLLEETNEVTEND